MCLSCHSFGKKCLTSSRRSYKKGSLRQLGSDGSIFPRIMKKINYFLEGFLGFILTGYILKSNTCFLLDICLGTAFTHAHHSAALIHTAHEHHKKYK